MINPAAEAPSAPRSGVRSLHAELIALRAEVAALERACDQYRQSLTVDPLTGLYGRDHFDERLEHEWRRALHFWTPLSLIAIDLADPHHIAARSGRGGLERTLAQLGAWLRSEVREIDIAFRIGAASFAVLLPGTGRLGAEGELQRLEKAAQRPPPNLGTSPSLGFGLAVAHDDAHTPLELLIMADEAALMARSRTCDDERHETIPIPRPPSWLPAA